ncbi:amidohydrolase family protein [Colwellia demingiae]|uniref:Amidohydrolase family protein n=1 Tax=Colwellia demingiae TaxID=89401 RepID=A0A5C6QCQ8_9GAMM|nr:amidohydrolase family protein [Colwellia demingiae]TWX66865.1 amidohydrolase family protein [Colwellia demingiae]
MNIERNVVETDIPKVDSHQHFWQLSRGEYNWLKPELTELYKDFLPKQLERELYENDVSQTILVQAEESEDEIHFMLAIAEVNEFVAGVVGWIDMEASDVIDKLEEYHQNRYFKGIRPMLQDIDDVNWILKDEFTPVFEFMAKNQFTFDALIRDIHISNIQILAQRYPDLSIVINHCAKPDLSKSPSDFWRHRLTNIAVCKNVFIKLSGLLTEAPQGKVDIAIVQPYFDHIMDSFGSDRVMWGSDWPVIKLNGDYDTWVSLTHALLKDYSLKDKRKVWAGNAQQFYNLPSSSVIN